ncbi:unnamed protein product [Phaeothamnion confervicola]
MRDTGPLLLFVSSSGPAAAASGTIVLTRAAAPARTRGEQTTLPEPNAEGGAGVEVAPSVLPAFSAVPTAAVTATAATPLRPSPSARAPPETPVPGGLPLSLAAMATATNAAATAAAAEAAEAAPRAVTAAGSGAANGTAPPVGFLPAVPTLWGRYYAVHPRDSSQTQVPEYALATSRRRNSTVPPPPNVGARDGGNDDAPLAGRWA